jgi:hypothetical protein
MWRPCNTARAAGGRGVRTRTDWWNITLDARDLARSIIGEPATLRFTIDGASFKPFYETFGLHLVYLHVTQK